MHSSTRPKIPKQKTATTKLKMPRGKHMHNSTGPKIQDNNKQNIDK